jgi:hypothetical protein
MVIGIIIGHHELRMVKKNLKNNCKAIPETRVRSHYLRNI